MDEKIKHDFYSRGYAKGYNDAMSGKLFDFDIAGDFTPKDLTKHRGDKIFREEAKKMRASGESLR